MSLDVNKPLGLLIGKVLIEVYCALTADLPPVLNEQNCS